MYFYPVSRVAISKTNRSMINNAGGICYKPDYYDIYSKIYLDIWENYDNLSLHIGYYDNEEDQSHDQSIIKMNRYIANLAQIKESDLILDAGCGIGGSSLWFAENYGAKIVGISLSEKEVNAAKKFAKEKFIKKVEFKVMDFHNTNFSSSTFDKVLAIESVCYSLKKEKFLDECFRLLKTGGKIVIADYFHSDNPMTFQERKAIERVNEDFSIQLCSMIQFKELLKNFEDLMIFDVTSNVSKFYVDELDQIEKSSLKTRSKESKKYMKKEFGKLAHEFECLQQGLIKYRVIFAVKKKDVLIG